MSSHVHVYRDIVEDERDDDDDDGIWPWRTMEKWALQTPSSGRALSSVKGHKGEKIDREKKRISEKGEKERVWIVIMYPSTVVVVVVVISHSIMIEERTELRIFLLRAQFLAASRFLLFGWLRGFLFFCRAEEYLSGVCQPACVCVCMIRPRSRNRPSFDRYLQSSSPVFSRAAK